MFGGFFAVWNLESSTQMLMESVTLRVTSKTHKYSCKNWMKMVRARNICWFSFLLFNDTRFSFFLSVVQREYILFHDFIINSTLFWLLFFFKGENEILYTYDVKWEKSDIRWASRWDIYLTMSDVQIHWFSIINSVVVVIFLSGMMSTFTCNESGMHICACTSVNQFRDHTERKMIKTIFFSIC